MKNAPKACEPVRNVSLAAVDIMSRIERGQPVQARVITNPVPGIVRGDLKFPKA